MSASPASPASPNMGQQSKWVTRYMAELARWVPAKNLAGAEAAVRAAVAQSLATTSDGDKAVLATLKTLGAPQRLALQYGGGRSLIGPVLYPIFLKVLQIVLAIVLALNLFAIFFAIGWKPEPLSAVGAFTGVLAALFEAAGIVVLIFAAIERVSHIQAKDLDKDWNPKSLPAAQENDRIRMGETIFEIVAGIVALVVLAFFLDRLGGYYVPGQGWSSFPIFSAHFQSFVPWLILWLALDTLLTIAVFAQGYWQPLTRILKIALNVGALLLFYFMLTGDALLAMPAFEVAARITVAIAMVVTVFDVAKQAARIVRRPLSDSAQERVATP